MGTLQIPSRFSGSPAVASALQPSRGVLSLRWYYALAVGSAISLFTANPLLTAASLLTLFSLAALLWRPGRSPALLYVAGYQWAQVSTLVFIADASGKPLTEIARWPSVETAVWLGLVGLIVLGTGMALAIRGCPSVPHELLQRELRAMSVDRLVGAYLVMAVVAAVMPYIAWKILPLSQLLLYIASVKWIFYMLLGYATLHRRVKVVYFVGATLLEFVAGIGFFSEFKTVLILAVLVLFSLHVRVRARTLMVGAAVAAITFLVGLSWMSIRDQYRSFLNQGTGQQVVLVSPVQQVTTFGELVGSIDKESLASSFELIFRRIAYVDFFGAVIDYVPKQHPYENGGLVLRAADHLLVPRILDPDKPVLESDSEMTMRYTGLIVSGSEQGTSISLGYMAEAYIDFGPIGMFALILIFGLIWGGMYRWMLTRAPSPSMGLAFGTLMLLGASEFEIAELKLLGGMTTRFIVYAVLLRYVMPQVQRWLIARSGQRYALGATPNPLAEARS